MKSAFKLLVIIFIFGLSMHSFSTTKLAVQDPQQTWRYDTGSIEDAMLTVKPIGAFVEYSLTLSFSSRGTAMTGAGDTLEIQYFFDLPENAHIVDAWLWIEDTVMQARLLDKGQAILIYEGIVKRRRDPLILFKQSQTSYELRIFPMAGNNTRRARITWIEPVAWNESNVLTNLPLHLINCAKNKPGETIVMLYNDDVWKNVKITDNPALTVIDDYWSEFGTCKSVAVPNNALKKNWTLAFDNPAKNGVFVSAYEEKANEGFYNLIVQPSKALSFYTKKKILFLVDYDAAKSDFTRTEVIDNLKSAIAAYLTPNDSFNIIFSRNDAQPISTDWIPCEPDAVNIIFDNLPQNILSYYSMLPVLMNKGAEFVKNHNYECSIFLVSNSDAFGNNKLANPLIEDYTAAIGRYVQFNIADYSTKYRNIYTMNNRNYTGNEYLYSYLSVSSGGFYTDIMKFNNSFQNLMAQSFKLYDGQINSFELYPAATNGFCYGRYLLTGSNQSYSSLPIVQLGKWVGEMPFTITATGFYKNNAFSKIININDADIYWTSQRTKQTWTGTYIKTLELGTKTNDIVKEIISTSISNRVLSLYTAFLALEPERQQQQDENQTSVDEFSDNDIISIKSYPNPFTDYITFSVTLSGQSAGIENVEIYDMTGIRVRTFTVSEISDTKELRWDGCDSFGTKLPDGMYIVRFRTSKGVVHIKVMLIHNY